MEITSEYVKIKMGDLLKQSNPKNHLVDIFIEVFTANPSICVVETLRDNITKISSIRSDSNLFNITQKPYPGASKDTIAK